MQAQAGLTLFRRILNDVFGQDLKDSFPREGPTGNYATTTGLCGRHSSRVPEPTSSDEVRHPPCSTRRPTWYDFGNEHLGTSERYETYGEYPTAVVAPVVSSEVLLFSCLVFISYAAKARSIILLLDEPGLSLHAKAQEDLLRYFEKELSPHHQLMLHNPFTVHGRPHAF